MIFVSGNNRGHDFGALMRRSGKALLPGGGVWEIFEESDRDIEAWIDFIQANYSHGSIILMGHSFGSGKALHHLSATQDQIIFS